MQDFSDSRYLFTATRKGIVKKTVLSAYGNIRRDGIIALKIQDDDSLIGAAITEGEHDILLVPRKGMFISIVSLPPSYSTSTTTGCSCRMRAALTKGFFW